MKEQPQEGERYWIIVAPIGQKPFVKSGVVERTHMSKEALLRGTTPSGAWLSIVMDLADDTEVHLRDLKHYQDVVRYTTRAISLYHTPEEAIDEWLDFYTRSPEDDNPKDFGDQSLTREQKGALRDNLRELKASLAGNTRAAAQKASSMTNQVELYGGPADGLIAKTYQNTPTSITVPLRRPYSFAHAVYEPNPACPERYEYVKTLEPCGRDPVA